MKDHRLVLSSRHISQMEAHVNSCLPEEGCGLLAGVGQRVELTIPITNQLHSPVRYNMEPEELVRAFYDLEARGLEMLASFHAHPSGPDTPSETDIREFAYPGTFMLIWSGAALGWQVKGFDVFQDAYREIELRITD
ncbi:MAG: M67 family metallopeptidase [Bellilinea sp.]